MKRLYLTFRTHRSLADLPVVEESDDWYRYTLCVVENVDVYGEEMFQLDLAHYCDLMTVYEASTYSFYVK